MAEPEFGGVIDTVTTPQHYLQPTTRDLRAQAIHRLQIGLVGLGTMLLLVGLANIIMDRAQDVSVEDPVNDVIAVDEQPKEQASDPLADIGVVPSSDPQPEPAKDAEAELIAPRKQ